MKKINMKKYYTLEVINGKIFGQSSELFSQFIEDCHKYKLINCIVPVFVHKEIKVYISGYLEWRETFQSLLLPGSKHSTIWTEHIQSKYIEDIIQIVQISKQFYRNLYKKYMKNKKITNKIRLY